MLDSMQLVEMLRELTETKSDYAVAKILGIRPQTICNWKSGRGAMSEEIAVNTALILELDPCYVLACVCAERAMDTPLFSTWVEIVERLTPKKSRKKA